MVVAMANNGMPPSAPPDPAAANNISPPPDYYENERIYHGWHRGKYMCPCDEMECDRLDIYHKFFAVARKGALHSIPFIPNYDRGPRILDLGTGTGIWAIDMAEQYTTAEILGWDISILQPEFIPGIVRFERRDIESPWHGTDFDSWDLIYMRMLNGSIANWPEMYAKVFRHLKPGYGVLEQVEIDLTPRCDDNTMPPNSSLVNWTRLLLDATARAGRPIAYNPGTKQILESIGFVEVQEQVIKVPFNPWSSDPHLKEIGRWYNLGLTEGLQALTLAPLTRVLGWPVADVNRLIEDTKREICSKKHHTYCEMHIWTARRPPPPS